MIKKTNEIPEAVLIPFSAGKVTIVVAEGVPHVETISKYRGDES